MRDMSRSRRAMCPELLAAWSSVMLAVKLFAKGEVIDAGIARQSGCILSVCHVDARAPDLERARVGAGARRLLACHHLIMIGDLRLC